MLIKSLEQHYEFISSVFIFNFEQVFSQWA